VAHSLSSKKRIRQNEKRRGHNRARRAVLKTKLRKCKETLGRGTVEAAAAAFHDAAQALDIAAGRRTVHPNAAARRKSRLARRLNALKAKSTTG
jgi:small subunit ribosomal protein S20